MKVVLKDSAITATLEDASLLERYSERFNRIKDWYYKYKGMVIDAEVVGEAGFLLGDVAEEFKTAKNGIPPDGIGDIEQFGKAEFSRDYFEQVGPLDVIKLRIDESQS